VERNHRMELQYDGTGLHGWAKQVGLQTVENCLQDALRTVLGQAPVLRVAARTDAGVHARRQVVSLLLPQGLDLPKLRRSLNALTPPSVAVLALRAAPAEFDARKDAVSRTYRYFVSAEPVVSPFWAAYCWHVFGQSLDAAAMREAAALVVGRHDFTAFTPTETVHMFFDRKVLRCRWMRGNGAAFPAGALGASSTRSGEEGSRLLCLEAEADAFLRHMVRTLVGTMIDVGQGVRSLEDFRRLLEGAPRGAAGPTAPPQGLFLWDIRYPRRGMNSAAYGKIAAEVGGAFTEETADSEA
jgi:tRNA pseudouridine38-40 synthase